MANALRQPGDWRERALARSLEKVQVRSLDEIDRLFRAASDLAIERGDTGFTVQQVVALAGVSLKAFYRHFAGKDDLLVALFEERTRTGAELLREIVASHDEPVARIEAAIRMFSDRARDPDDRDAAFITREHFRLSQSRPTELERALEPLVQVFADEIAAAAASGAIASSDPRRDAVSVLHLVVAYTHARVLGLTHDAPDVLADHVWSFCARALGVATVRA
jgi:TetR/AcrR family transcriptional regulator